MHKDSTGRLEPAFGRQYDRLIGVRAGAKRMLGLDASLDAITERLKSHSLLQLLDLAGRIDAVLREAGTSDISGQLRIAGGLFGSETMKTIARRMDLMSTRIAEADRDPSGVRPRIILFNQQQLATFVTIAANVVDLTTQDSGKATLDGVGEALLMIDDLVDERANIVRGEDPLTEVGEQTWTYYMAVAAATEGGHPTATRIVRTVEMFLSSHPNLVGDPDYIDLSALFENATGLNREDYFLAVTLMLGSMLGIDAQNVHERKATIVHRDLRTLGLSAGAIQAILRLGGEAADSFIAAVRHEAPLTAIRPLYQLPLERSPLVHFEDRSVCLSIGLLERRLTDGLYHVLLNANSESAARLRFMRFVGKVFTDYAVRTLERAVRYHHTPPRRRRLLPTKACRLHTGAALEATLKRNRLYEKVADGLCLLGTDLLVFEAKAQMLSLGARTDTRRQDFFAKMREIAIDGAEQLEQTISQVAAGVYLPLGIDPARIRRVFPLVVSLQQFFMNPMLRKWIDDQLKDRGILQRKRVAKATIQPLELIDVNDLEWIELLTEHGDLSLSDLLARKRSSAFGRGQSVANWWMVTKTANVVDDARSTHYSRAYDELQGATLARHRPVGETGPRQRFPSGDQ